MYACVEASVRLGLSTALCHGDRVLCKLQQVDAREELIILGACRGRLWYRMDNQQGISAAADGSANIW